MWRNKWWMTKSDEITRSYSFSTQINLCLGHWKKKWNHFDLNSWVTSGTKIWPGIRVILVPLMAQLFRSKWLHFFFSDERNNFVHALFFPRTGQLTAETFMPHLLKAFSTQIWLIKGPLIWSTQRVNKNNKIMEKEFCLA